MRRARWCDFSFSIGGNRSADVANRRGSRMLQVRAAVSRAKPQEGAAVPGHEIAWPGGGHRA